MVAGRRGRTRRPWQTRTRPPTRRSRLRRRQRILRTWPSPTSPGSRLSSPASCSCGPRSCGSCRPANRRASACSAPCGRWPASRSGPRTGCTRPAPRLRSPTGRHSWASRSCSSTGCGTARRCAPIGVVAILGGVALVAFGATAPAPLVGTGAILVSATSFLPQAVVAWRAVDVRGVSAPTYWLLALSASLWMFYGVTARDLLVIAPNLLIAPTATVIAARRVSRGPVPYRRRRRRSRLRRGTASCAPSRA